MKIISIDSGLNGAYSMFENGEYLYSKPMPTRKVITQQKLMQLDLKDGKKQVIKSGPKKGTYKMKVRRPEKTKKELDVETILEAMQEADHIIIERQQPMIGNSAQSSFTIGINYGKLFALAELSGDYITLVMPSVWKKYLKLSRDKLDSVEMAESLTGKSFRTDRGRLLHDEAESMLIGHWFLENNKG